MTQLLSSKWLVMERIQMISQFPCFSSSTRKEISYWMQSGSMRLWKCSFLIKQKTEVRSEVIYTNLASICAVAQCEMYNSDFYCYPKVQMHYLVALVFCLTLVLVFFIRKPLSESCHYPLPSQVNINIQKCCS